MIFDLFFSLALAALIIEIVAFVLLILAWIAAKRSEETEQEDQEVECSNGGGCVPEEESCWIIDYERCDDVQQLHVVMDEINRCQYQLISVTQDSNDIYTVFFRRCVVG